MRSRRSRGVAGVVLVLALAGVAAVGCSGDDDDQGLPATTTAGGGATTSTSVVPSSTTGTTTEPVIEQRTAPVLFDLPSGNLGCVMADTGVRCDALQHTYTPPPTEDDCLLDYGHSVELQRAEGRPYFACSGDTMVGSGPALPYGTGVDVGWVTCVSSVAGVTCTSDEGHGFFLSREAYRFF